MNETCNRREKQRGLGSSGSHPEGKIRLPVPVNLFPLPLWTPTPALVQLHPVVSTLSLPMLSVEAFCCTASTRTPPSMIPLILLILCRATRAADKVLFHVCAGVCVCVADRFKQSI